MIFLQLFWEFFKTGLFAVGGGMATVPFLYDMGERMGWFTDAQLADMIAVADSTPGPIGVNMATYVGYTSANGVFDSPLMGILGALVATFSLVLPSVIVVLIVAKVLKAFKDNFYVKSAFYGLRPASTGLITAEYPCADTCGGVDSLDKCQGNQKAAPRCIHCIFRNSGYCL